MSDGELTLFLIGYGLSIIVATPPVLRFVDPRDEAQGLIALIMAILWPVTLLVAFIMLAGWGMVALNRWLARRRSR